MMNSIDSGLPLPVGTSHALETFMVNSQEPYDRDRVIPTPLHPLEYYDYMYINLLTMVRNLLSAYQGEYNKDQAAQIMMRDMNFISEYVQAGNKKIKVRFFISKASPKFILPSVKGRMRVKTTAKGQLFNDRRISILNTVGRNGARIFEYIDGVRGDNKNSILVSHYALDVLKHFTHNTMTVLSSHTGATTDRLDYYKLYYPIPKLNMSVFPFNQELLRFLGDKTIMSPAPIGQRRKLYSIAIAKNWSAVTTKEKIRQNLRDLDLELYTEIFQTK